MLGPWAGCVQRTPPTYQATPDDYISDIALQVNSGDATPDFSLARANETGTRIRLSDLLSEKAVVLQFGAYTW